jgi:hypothetical protein
MLWYIYSVVRISGHAVSNTGVMVEWLIRTDLEESGRDPREFLWRRHLLYSTTKKFSLKIGVCVSLCAIRNLVDKIRRNTHKFYLRYKLFRK